MTDLHIYSENVPSAMGKQAFVEVFGGVYEHSPWIAEAVWELKPSSEHVAGRDSAVGIQKIFKYVLDQADHDAKLTLLRAHPDLAVNLAVQQELTVESSSEQAGAGLGNCTNEEFAAFQELNQRYKEKFEFPFILAVRGNDRSEILKIFRRRVENDLQTEFETALEQVHRIALSRLSDIP